MVINVEQSSGLKFCKSFILRDSNIKQLEISFNTYVMLHNIVQIFIHKHNIILTKYIRNICFKLKL